MFKRNRTRISLFVFFIAGCAGNKASSDEKQLTAATVINSEEQKATVPIQDNGIVGTWKLRLEVFDDNSNRVPDEAEMKKGYGNNYIFQFNADGSCRIQQIYKGRYEKITEDGRPMLKVYRQRIAPEEEKDPPPDIYQITSVKKDELVLLNILMGDPTSFWFFKRIN